MVWPIVSQMEAQQRLPVGLEVPQVLTVLETEEPLTHALVKAALLLLLSRSPLGKFGKLVFRLK